jgi:octaprenyl-diphosphate synthase
MTFGMKVKEMLQAVERKIEQLIADLNDKDVRALYQQLPSGKRLRAKLILKIAGSELLVIKTAAVVEMIHAASLLHDDVIDDAYTRRAKPSLNALYGNKTSIMLGDILYAKGFFELGTISPEVAKIISNAVIQLSLGELKDVSLSNAFNTDKAVYLEMIYQKTASLMEASAGAAALLAGKPKESYMTYGKNLGLAFQMMHDFEEGKTTLPYIYLHEALPSHEKETLKSLHAKKLRPVEQQWIKSKMQEHQIIQKAYDEARQLIEEAIALMDSRGEAALSGIALQMIERDF